MSISLYLGLPGSGKTAHVVRYMMLNSSHRIKYSNIETKGMEHTILIKPEMIFMHDPARDTKQHKGVKLNTDFWVSERKKYGSMDIILDEAHTLFNARRSMQRINLIMTDFLALIRRMLGSNDSGMGELILLTQLDRRIDIIARESATSILWHLCHYTKQCQKCGTWWQETNETPKKMWECIKCKSPYIKKQNHVIEVWEFKNMEAFELWRMRRIKTYYAHYVIEDIEQYFTVYDTMQITGLMTDDVIFD